MDKSKPDGVHGFQDSEQSHTPIAENVKSHDLYPPPGGRIAWQGASPSTTGDGIQHSREGNRTYTGKEVHGKVEVAGNHPNKKLQNLYG